MTSSPADSAATNTSSLGTKILGSLTAAMFVLLVPLSLVWTKPDTELGDTVRIMYIHVPSVVAAYMCVAVCALASGWYLWRRSEFADTVAGASGEIAMLLLGITLVTGMLWGRSTWGNFWQWDPRLTSTALLFLMLVGYVNLRRMGGTRSERGTRSAVVALSSLVLVPVVHKSVEWWNSLHQAPTVLGGASGNIGGLQLFTLMFGMVAWLCLTVWMLVHRFRVGWLEDQAAGLADDVAIQQRRAETVGR